MTLEELARWSKELLTEHPELADRDLLLTLPGVNSLGESMGLLVVDTGDGQILGSLRYELNPEEEDDD